MAPERDTQVGARAALMLLRLWHALSGHDWSDWAGKSYGPYFRFCRCGRAECSQPRISGWAR